MDPLHEHHVHNAHNEQQVSHQTLVAGLASHGLRHVLHHEHVLKTITPRMQYSNDFVPQHYSNTKHIQHIQW